MGWNWQHPDWPRFEWDPARLVQAEDRFRTAAAVRLGTERHLTEPEREQLRVDAITHEALTTSEIEGEHLDRASVQSSIRRHFGLSEDSPSSARPREDGIAEMTVHAHRESMRPLDEDSLCTWHTMIMRGRQDLRIVGGYRTHVEPMQIVSGKIYDPTVHFEAPPSAQVAGEMERFIDWFNRTESGGQHLPPLTRAGVAHLYFESIHPFEDGNGRLGRAVTEKALAQGLGRPTLVALSTQILDSRRAYYDVLETFSTTLEITPWLAWFAGIAIEAQDRIASLVEFLIEKGRYLARFDGELNDRQSKVIRRMLREGPAGFEGGLSASNYKAIAKTSSATATRDLAGLVELGALVRSGERRHARYRLPIDPRPTSRIIVQEDGSIEVRDR